MKKQPLIFLLCFLLLLMLSLGWHFLNLPDFALKSAETLLQFPFLQEVFDLSEKEAVAVFGEWEEDTLV